jgi:acyl-CoA synthetase (AMP-forming)/AMP-acid ligase II
MHQAILARAASQGEVIRSRPLRFIRSSSAPLPGPVSRDLERVFGAPVLTAYGMTEASHQVTGNSSRSRPQIFGTVGIPWGLEVAIMQDGVAQATAQVSGEVVIRGPSVMDGYLDNPHANQQGFVNGWFRTGDEGTIDGGGHLTLTGRLKDMINRGGEKISPFEIEDVLLAHPAVEQAVCFAIRHPLLGQEIAAAVVLRPEFNASASELQRLAREHLANWKVPRQILTVKNLPHGATGKVARMNMAKLLRLES